MLGMDASAEGRPRRYVFQDAPADRLYFRRQSGSARDCGRSDGMNMDQASKTPLLDRVNSPQDLRHLPEKDLRQLCDELRQETIDAVSVTGGHLGAGLGVVELTVALH